MFLDIIKSDPFNFSRFFCVSICGSFFLQPDQPPVFLPTNLSAQNGSGVVESSELADLLMNLNIEPMSHVLDEATGIEH